MLGNNIRNKPKHRNRHLQDRSTYLQISKCNSFLIPSSCTPPRRGEGPLSRGGQKLAAHPRSGSPLCVPPPAGQVGALTGAVPVLHPAPPDPQLVRKPPAPAGWLTSSGARSVPEISLEFSACSLILLMVVFHFSPISVGQRPFWVPPPSPRHTHRAYSHFPILSAVVMGVFLSRASDVPTFTKFESKSETEHFWLPLGRQRQVEYKSPRSHSVKILVV